MHGPKVHLCLLIINSCLFEYYKTLILIKLLTSPSRIRTKPTLIINQSINIYIIANSRNV